MHAIPKKSLEQLVIERTESAEELFRSAAAICDAAKVLSALENLPGGMAKPGERTMMTGNGFADGYCLRDSTLPELLFHATELIEDGRKLLRNIGEPKLQVVA